MRNIVMGRYHEETVLYADYVAVMADSNTDLQKT